jgi:hypothetical protein
LPQDTDTKIANSRASKGNDQSLDRILSQGPTLRVDIEENGRQREADDIRQEQADQ